MPVISPTQFLQIADRLAALYDLLLQVERRLTVPQNTAASQSGQAYPARLLLDLTGTGVHVLLQAKVRGTIGNGIFFSLVNPGTANATLSSQSFGSNLVVSLATDAAGLPSSITEEVISLLDTNSDFNSLLNVFFPVSGIGGIVQSFPMTALSGGIGSGGLVLPSWSIRTVRPGPEGNGFTLTIVQPTAPSATFSGYWDRTNLVVSLPTDSSGNPTETFTQFKIDLATITGDFIVTATNGSALVPAVATTLFSGGGVGSFAQVVLTPPPGSRTDSADPDVAASLASAASNADTKIDAPSLSQGIDYINNLQQALVSHFTTVRYSGGMAGFMADNNLLVHKNFSLVNNNRQGNYLNAANVFRPDPVVLATITMASAAVTFGAGVPLGTGSGTQSEINYAAQSLIAVLVPAGGILAADWSFSLNLVDSTGTSRTSSPLSFTAGSTTGATVAVTSTANPDKHFRVISGLWISGGTTGDRVFITQVVERRISL